MKKLALSLFILSSIPFLTSCQKDKHPHLSIQVDHRVDAQYLEFDTLKYVNSIGHKYEVQTLKYFISNVQLNKSDGTNTILKGPFYIDAEDPTTFSLDTQIDLPTGSYNNISLTFGLDTVTNVTNSLTSIEAIGMNWPTPMGGGYHYMKLEGSYDSLQLGVPKNFAVHTGASMGNPYHIDLYIPNSNFIVGSKNISIIIQMNVNEWFTEPNDYDFASYPAMIMMNMPAQMAIKTNGSSVFSAIIN